jgi:hypothetical protein
MIGALQGAGASFATAVISMMSYGIRVTLAWFIAIMPFNAALNAAVYDGLYATVELAKAAGTGMSHYMGLFHAQGSSMICAASLALLYYAFGKWQTKGVVQRAETTSGSDA